MNGIFKVVGITTYNIPLLKEYNFYRRRLLKFAGRPSDNSPGWSVVRRLSP